MIIQHNIAALNSHRQLGINNSATSKNLEKLSSGYRINRAGDDAAGLAISEKMRGQIRGLAMAEQNVSNGISLIQTAEGGLQETHAILQRMRELAVQSANGTYDNDVDRYNLNKEIDALKEEIDRIASSTHYNGINLLDGSVGGATGLNAAKDQFEISAITATLTTTGVTFTEEATYSGSFSLMFIEDSDPGATTPKVFISFDNGVWEDASAIWDGTDTISIKDERGVTIEVKLTNYDGSSGVINNIEWSYQIEGNTGVFSVVNGSNKASLDNAVSANRDCNIVFQIGANGTADQQVGIHVDNMSSYFIGLWERDNNGNYVSQTTSIQDISIATQTQANDAIAVIDAAINQVSSTRSDLGALQNRLEHTLNNLGVTKENLTAAESTIRDVDMAKEMMEYTKNTILVQASQAMLAQAQQLPQGVLQLLR